MSNATHSLLPLGRGGQMHNSPCFATQPFSIANGVIPTHMGHRMVAVITVVPVGIVRLAAGSGVYALGILGIGNLGLHDLVAVKIDLMHRFLIAAAII